MVAVAWLIAARVLQGIAAAILTPSSLALIGAVYPKDERNRAVGVWAAASALTTAGGPVLGGWLVESSGWQSVFWINPPLAIVVVGLLVVPLQVALIPVAYTTGGDFKPAARPPVERITYWDTWGATRE